MTTQDIEIKDYNYELPDERIAKYPIPERDMSKMLVYEHGQIYDDTFRNITHYLPQGELLVFNNTRVIRARLHFRKETGALIEIFCLEPEYPRDYAMMFQQKHECVWRCMVGNRKKWKSGALKLQIHDKVVLTAEPLVQKGNTFQSDSLLNTPHDSSAGSPPNSTSPTSDSASLLIHFTWTGDYDFAHILEAVGELPIPPYLNRHTQESDLTTYQTVYSKIKGSVAAPTAGLHFTDRVLSELDTHGIEREEVTLHVGAGTFKPVKSEHIGAHDMHSEHIFIHRRTIERLLAHGGHCTAVGTTSVRTLESLYYIGVMLLAQTCELHNRTTGTHEIVVVPQWLPYNISTTVSTTEALQIILTYLDDTGQETLQAATRIIIAPGYRYHVVRRILTNFHQPQSTLLLLVSAFLGGTHWRTIYTHALRSDYRFLSYGDCCLLTP